MAHYDGRKRVRRSRECLSAMSHSGFHCANLMRTFSLVRQLKSAQMRYFDFVPVGLKIMSHYCDIIQEIMVFGKSTMICVSSNTVYLLTYIGVTSLPTACQVTVLPCSSVLHASFAVVKLGWSKSRSSQAFQSFAVYTPRGPSLSLNSGRPTI